MVKIMMLILAVGSALAFMLDGEVNVFEVEIVKNLFRMAML
jgi:hypothetical protein